MGGGEGGGHEEGEQWAMECMDGNEGGKMERKRGKREEECRKGSKGVWSAGWERRRDGGGESREWRVRKEEKWGQDEERREMEEKGRSWKREEKQGGEEDGMESGGRRGRKRSEE